MFVNLSMSTFAFEEYAHSHSFWLCFFFLSLVYSVRVCVVILDKYVDVIDRLWNARITTYDNVYMSLYVLYVDVLH